jgi:hypothetical protein
MATKSLPSMISGSSFFACVQIVVQNMHCSNAAQAAFALHAALAVCSHAVAPCKHVSHASPGVGSGPDVEQNDAAHCVAHVPGVPHTQSSNAFSPTAAPAWFCW